MKGFRSLVVVSLLSLAAMVGLLGCDSGGGNNLTTPSTTDTTPATVRVLMVAHTPGRATVPSEVGVLIEQLALLPDGVDVDAEIPDAWDPKVHPTNPTLPIPMLEGVTLVELLTNGLPNNFVPVVTAQVPAGLYAHVKLLLDQTSVEFLNGQQIPYNPETYSALLPIIGGLSVKPGETTTLLVDMFSGEASELLSGGTY